MRELERRVVLSVLDRKWREHLYEMDYLQEGIGLRAMAQRDPLVEYQREGFDLFSAMMDGIKEESVGYLFNLEVQVAGGGPPRRRRPPTPRPRLGRPERGGASPLDRAKGLPAPQRPAQLQYSAPTVDGQPARRAADALASSSGAAAVRGRDCRATLRAPAARARSTSAATATRNTPAPDPGSRGRGRDPGRCDEWACKRASTVVEAHLHAHSGSAAH